MRLAAWVLGTAKLTGLKAMSAKKIIRLSASPVGFGQQQDPLEPHMFASELPVQHTHMYYEDDDHGLYIGVWDTTDMVENSGPYACDEFMWVLEGEVEIKNSKTGTMELVRAGEAFVIPRGYDCQWHQKGYLRKFFVILEHPDEPMPPTPTVEGIVKLPGSGAQQSSVCYENSTGKFTAGVWQGDTFESEMTGMAYNQFVYLHEGTLGITEKGGEKHTFKAGEAFFVPQGAVCRWYSTDSVYAFYATVKIGEV